MKTLQSRGLNRLDSRATLHIVSGDISVSMYLFISKALCVLESGIMFIFWYVKNDTYQVDQVPYTGGMISRRNERLTPQHGYKKRLPGFPLV